MGSKILIDELNIDFHKDILFKVVVIHFNSRVNFLHVNVYNEVDPVLSDIEGIYGIDLWTISHSSGNLEDDHDSF